MTFTVHTGTAVPMRRSDVDTDQIIPARFVPYFSWTGHTNALFADWRAEPDFVLNLPQYQGATILVAGRRFGTGSSRESAVWAIQKSGFIAVIAPSFGDIFRSNAFMRRLAAIELPAAVVESLWELIEQDSDLRITIDIEQGEVRYGGFNVAFDLDPQAKHRMLGGVDMIADTLRHVEDIVKYESLRRPTLPKTG
ncbi:3-isopropylmalate dehydratase small subunit [Micromonospora sp. NPDC051227]|uniref:3-isopropylmalate dehydratase small subunit n=1 Tax=Micromonospora sp. NPDC051227 TaxID=3364285 RepID=UPI0037A586D0